MTQDIGNFSLIKNELLRKVVMYYAALSSNSLDAAIEHSLDFCSAQSILVSLFNWNNEQGFDFWREIHFRLRNNPATELTEHELKTLQPIIDKINEQCK